MNVLGDVVAQAARSTIHIDPTALLVVGIVFAVLTAVVAVGKGRSAIGWGILGFLFGLIPLIIVLVMKRKTRTSY